MLNIIYNDKLKLLIVILVYVLFHYNMFLKDQYNCYLVQLYYMKELRIVQSIKGMKKELLLWDENLMLGNQIEDLEGVYFPTFESAHWGLKLGIKNFYWNSEKL